MAEAGVSTRIMVDCSHGNSSKQPENQARVIDSIAQQVEAGETRIGGVMLESHLIAGRQDLVAGRALVYGQSITDGCIDWESSVPILERLAAAVVQRRRSRS
jgi:3-deoxy-7-phosphoheptulonate synthase